MCGISGIISLNNAGVDLKQLCEMTKLLRDRGPDGEGYLITHENNEPDQRAPDGDRRNIFRIRNRQQLGLGHTRLSITDLSSGAAQPMADITERYWIVFNGQIYNHVALRKELEEKGYRFKTHHSDTEVILNSYHCWGVDCLKRFNGMWAFCLWDSLENKIFISRDRIGKQPLYYTTANKTFYFASELKSLLTVNAVKRELNEFSVYDYLTYTFVPSPNTMFKNIFKVPGAHYCLFTPGDPVQFKKYWDLTSLEPITDLSEKEIVDEVRKKLEEGTKLRMPADVNSGMLLSGGLDSSINLACMSMHSPAPIKAYTVGFENGGGYMNEFKYARKVADFFKADLREVVVNEKQFFELLPKMTYLQDEPIADAANVPLYYVSKAAKEDHIKVLLSGEGADELFIGYEHWRLIYQFERFMRNKPKLAGILDFFHKKSMFKDKGLHYQMWNYKVKNNWPVFWSGTELRTEKFKNEILTPDFLKKTGNYHSFMPFSDLYKSTFVNSHYDSFKWMSITDIQNRLPDLLLARLDRMMMASSIEGRNPFLDVSLVEFVLRLPSEIKVKEKKEKYLLKRAFAGVLPSEIINRAKDSFTVPLGNLFKGSRLNDGMETIRSFNKENGIFMPHYLKHLEKPENIKEFWNVLNLALWHQHFK